MRKVVIIGATSAIAESVARIYASKGDRLYLIGRNSSRLQSIADDLRIRGANEVGYGILDLNDFKDHASTLDKAWSQLGAVDVVLVAHGTLPDQAACDSSVEVAMTEFATNGTSTISLLNLAATRMPAESRGTIAVISSVAGDRGRASNYLYGAAKAAVSTYVSGLRQRLGTTGVNVLTIKPGFVDTPMTAAFKKGALWASADKVAQGIVKAIDRRKSVAYLPGFWSLIMLVIKTIPEPIFRRVKL